MMVGFAKTNPVPTFVSWSAWLGWRLVPRKPTVFLYEGWNTVGFLSIFCTNQPVGIGLVDSCPSKSFGLKFIPNQSDLFRNLFPRQSELIRVNPKKVFNLVWCNSVKNQSESIRDFESEWIRTNLSILMNPRSEFFWLIRIENSV